MAAKRESGWPALDFSTVTFKRTASGTGWGVHVRLYALGVSWLDIGCEHEHATKAEAQECGAALIDDVRRAALGYAKTSKW